MTVLRFRIASSQGDEYEVRATAADGRVWITCTCLAGEHGRQCKHRIGLLRGDVTAVLSGADDVSALAEMVDRTPIAAAMARYDAADGAAAAAKRRLDEAKRHLAQALLGR